VPFGQFLSLGYVLGYKTRSFAWLEMRSRLACTFATHIGEKQGLAGTGTKRDAIDLLVTCEKPVSLVAIGHCKPGWG